MCHYKHTIRAFSFLIQTSTSRRPAAVLAPAFRLWLFPFRYVLRSLRTSRRDGCDQNNSSLRTPNHTSAHHYIPPPLPWHCRSSPRTATDRIPGSTSCRSTDNTCGAGCPQAGRCCVQPPYRPDTSSRSLSCA